MEPDLRQTVGLLGLLLLGSVQAARGHYLAALVAVGLLAVTLLRHLVLDVRNRRWEARVRRWDRPEVWLILDAVRDREARRQRSAEAWERLNLELSSLAEAFGAGAEQAIGRVSAAFDDRFRGFGDRMIAAELRAHRDEEVRLL